MHVTWSVLFVWWLLLHFHTNTTGLSSLLQNLTFHLLFLNMFINFTLRLILIPNSDYYFLTVNKCDKQALAAKQTPLINHKLILQWYRFLFNGVRTIQLCHKKIWWVDGRRLDAPLVNTTMFLTSPFHFTLLEKWAPWRHAVLLWDCTS